MPKKMSGENSKATAARERKNEKLTADKNAKEKAKEDAYWEDDDKSLAKKQSRKEDQEKKRLEALAKKKERDELAAQEEKETLSKIVKVNPVKQTQARIREETERREIAAKKASTKPELETHLSKPIEVNVNRVNVDGSEARTIDEAISVLSVSSEPVVDKHPEKRMKAAYEEFENIRLPQLKSENPNMRLSQLKQMLRKEWQKHPNNPLIASMRS
ncbi:coiled-coil domain-containing protein 124 [Eurytemora carolleeae]|uniref:coiled-coil domain-containing protein 124 n=1 Tax=Eurytemora carolleeae TaxID=1294199 RepID=UPI000C759A2D|nr:coiled-coil domain-containing protein 124 [Eurytemora carolleeae]|eukprot:XP_023322221.1 coiled-coil domain-containing protein 124-like [Eurytemora affinis]